jgi:hypothetical protein
VMCPHRFGCRQPLLHLHQLAVAGGAPAQRLQLRLQLAHLLRESPCRLLALRRHRRRRRRLPLGRRCHRLQFAATSLGSRRRHLRETEPSVGGGLPFLAARVESQAEHLHPTGRERMTSPSLQTLQQPMVLKPWLSFRGHGNPNPLVQGVRVVPHLCHLPRLCCGCRRLRRRLGLRDRLQEHVRFCRYRFKFQSNLVWDSIKHHQQLLL